MDRLRLLSQLITKKESLFWTFFFGVLTIAAWIWPNIAVQNKMYFILGIGLSVIAFLILRAFWELLGESAADKSTLYNLENNRSIPLISLSNELNGDVRVLGVHEYSDELRLIVSKSPVLTIGTVVTLYHKDAKSGIEQFFGIGIVRFVQSDEWVQIAIDRIDFEPEQSRERLSKKDTKLLKNIKLSTIIYIEFLKQWSVSS